MMFQILNWNQRTEKMALSDMLIFPNPNIGVFTIQFDQKEKLKTKIEIINTQGKVVFKDNLGKFSGQYRKEIDLKNEGAGLYIVKVQQGSNLSSYKSYRSNNSRHKIEQKPHLDFLNGGFFYVLEININAKLGSQ